MICKSILSMLLCAYLSRLFVTLSKFYRKKWFATAMYFFGLKEL